MVFKAGNKDSQGVTKGKTGRKGYEIEQAQLVEMRALLTDFLKLAKKVMSGKDSSEDIKKIQLLERMILKMLDKLHASKTDMTSDGERLDLGVVVLPERE